MTGSAAVFADYAACYDLLYADKPYREEADYLAATLRRHGVDSGPLLELGCGTGGHAGHLCAAGYAVTGVERSAEMLARVAADAPWTPVCGDMATVSLPGRFRAALALFHVLGYAVRNEDLLAVLANVHRHLEPGGLFIFDAWYSPAVHAQQPAHRTRTVGDGSLSVTRTASPRLDHARNVVIVDYTIEMRALPDGDTRRFSESHEMRHFSLPEVDLLCRLAGFERLEALAFMTDDAPGTDSWGVMHVLRRAPDDRLHSR